MSGTAIGGQIKLAKQVIKTGGDLKKVPHEDQKETLKRKDTGILEIQGRTKKDGTKTNALVYHKPKKEPEDKGSKNDKHPKDPSKKAGESSRRSKDQDGAGRSSNGHVPKNETLQLGYAEKKMMTERNDDESKDKERPPTLRPKISVESYHTQSEAREVSASKARSTHQKSESGAPNSKQTSGKASIEEDNRSLISGSTSKTKRSSRMEQDDESVISGSTSKTERSSRKPKPEQDDESVISGSTSKTKRSSRTEQDNESVISGSTSKTERSSRKPKPEQDDESVISGSSSRTRKLEQSNTNAPIEQDARSKISGSRSGARTHSSRTPTEYSEGKPPKPDRSIENNSRGSKRGDSPSGQTERSEQSDQTLRQSDAGRKSKSHRTSNTQGSQKDDDRRREEFARGLRLMEPDPEYVDYAESVQRAPPSVAPSRLLNPTTHGRNVDIVRDRHEPHRRSHDPNEVQYDKPREETERHRKDSGSTRMAEPSSTSRGSGASKRSSNPRAPASAASSSTGTSRSSATHESSQHDEESDSGNETEVPRAPKSSRRSSHRSSRDPEKRSSRRESLDRASQISRKTDTRMIEEAPKDDGWNFRN
ncbi:uncharacterized protein EAE97_003034 [Botrytis byssoidea]|uniref:Uncharacterized protein n=1 Tax=Botrytis byssoidea TaxID=139641 RepID=A0A9P5IPM9_9HELO|nr:uncharacterized protein EAE97_003034 [Botrytis byssoidea]KAF7949525.1 hypothetical protein EAE97_003034 [Botrytis byssoidea]